MLQHELYTTIVHVTGHGIASVVMVFIFTVELWEIAGIVMLAAFFAMIKTDSCAI